MTTQISKIVTFLLHYKNLKTKIERFYIFNWIYQWAPSLDNIYHFNRDSVELIETLKNNKLNCLIEQNKHKL